MSLQTMTLRCYALMLSFPSGSILGTMKVPLAQQVQDILGQRDPVIITECVDNVALLIG